jgi:translation initiation factor RLI1
VGGDKKRPMIKEEKCTGCGICENKCPVDEESAIIVYSFGAQKKLKPESEPSPNAKG